MLAVARLTDTFACTDVIKTGSGNVFVNNLAIARVTDQTTGHGPPPCFWPSTVINKGSGSVFANNLAVARMTDTLATHCCGPACHDSVINKGSGNVFAG